MNHQSTRGDEMKTIRLTLTTEQAETLRAVLGAAICETNKNRVGATAMEYELMESVLRQLENKR